VALAGNSRHRHGTQRVRPSPQEPAEEPPNAANLVVSLDDGDPEEAAQRIIAVPVKRGLLPSLYSL
jgi:hypothetical protein